MGVEPLAPSWSPQLMGSLSAAGDATTQTDANLGEPDAAGREDDVNQCWS